MAQKPLLETQVLQSSACRPGETLTDSDIMNSLVLARIQFGVESIAHVDLDAAILQTCRQIYQEALPILYCENTFVFWGPKDLEAFRVKGLTYGTIHCEPGLVFSFILERLMNLA